MSTHTTTLEYMTTTKIGEKGQLTVPKEFRDELGLGMGAPVAVLRLGDGLILLPEQRRFERLCERVRSRLTAAGLTSEDILATLQRLALAFTKVATARDAQVTKTRRGVALAAISGSDQSTQNPSVFGL